MKYACIFIPDFPLQALLRVEPELLGRPVAILSSENRLSHASLEARKASIYPGMTCTQARSLLPSLIIRTVPYTVLKSAHQALLDLAWGFSPRVQDPEQGTVILDLEGTSRMYPSKPALGCALQHACRRMGFSCRIAFAKGPSLAQVAARAIKDGPEPVILLPPGREAEILAPLPLSALKPSEKLLETLHRLGLRTIGDIAKLSRERLGIHLGLEAFNLHLLANGEDKTSFEPRTPTEVFEESVTLDYLVERIEPLIFLLNAAIERLVLRLDARCKAPSLLRLTLHLDGGGKKIIEVPLALPTSDKKALLSLLQLRLEEGAPAPISGFALEAIPETKIHAQTDLFSPPSPDPSRLATLITRLQAIAGLDAVGSPGMSEDGLKIQVRHFMSKNNQITTSSPILAFWRFSPPILVEVRTDFEGKPKFVKGQGISGEVVEASGPWYSNKGWWREDTESICYFDIEVKNRGLFRLQHDLIHDRWLLEGWYD